jgi:hypothetical protein
MSHPTIVNMNTNQDASPLSGSIYSLNNSQISLRGMETYFGYIETIQDALLIFESCRLGRLPRVHRRLNERERRGLRSGSVYVWDEEESDVRRWTDGRLWSPSRIRGRFLVYRELSCRRTEAMDIDSPEDPYANEATPPRPLPTDPSNPNASLIASIPHPTRYGSKRLLFKPNGLIKRTIAIETRYGRRLHLISYFSESDLASGVLPRPRFDPRLEHIQIPRDIYPDLCQLLSDTDSETTTSNTPTHTFLEHTSRKMTDMMLMMDITSSSASASPSPPSSFPLLTPPAPTSYSPNGQEPIFIPHDLSNDHDRPFYTTNTPPLTPLETTYQDTPISIRTKLPPVPMHLRSPVSPTWCMSPNPYVMAEPIQQPTWQPRTDEDHRLLNVLSAHLSL